MPKRFISLAQIQIDEYDGTITNKAETLPSLPGASASRSFHAGAIQLMSSAVVGLGGWLS